MAEERSTLPKLMTVQELAEYLRVHPATVYKLLRHRQLPGFRIGTDWRFQPEEIERWCVRLAQRAKEPI